MAEKRNPIAINTGLEFSDDTAAAKFARAFIVQYATPAFGARSKSEIDLLIFTELIAAEVIKASDPIYSIARRLNVTPSRARNLLFNWELRTTATGADLKEELIYALKSTRYSGDGTFLTFGIERPLLKEEIVARLKQKGFFADSTFAKDVVRIPVGAFVEFLDDLHDKDTKDRILKALVTDKQLRDKSFKGVATAVLTKLGQKVVGEVAGDIAKGVVDGASGLLGAFVAGDAKTAATAAKKFDLIDT